MDCRAREEASFLRQKDEAGLWALRQSRPFAVCSSASMPARCTHCQTQKPTKIMKKSEKNTSGALQRRLRGRENETTLIENRPRTSALDRINANSYSGIRPARIVVLPWLPAVDQAVPGTSWVLEKKLGCEDGFSEVWLGRDRRLKTDCKYVLKFCFRADRRCAP